MHFKVGKDKVGSCEYDLQYLLNKAKKIDGGKCCRSPFMPEGQGCNLPIKPGTYGSKDKSQDITITFPKIPSIVEPFLSGPVRVRVEAISQSGQYVMCLKAGFNVKA